MARSKVFVSYSHNDARWLKRLQVHLTPLESSGRLELWNDTKLKAGSKWREEIRTAIDSAKVAVLLVSADFLASDFITTNELAPLLHAAAEKNRTTILPLMVGPSLFDRTPGLSDFHAVNPPAMPLVRLSRAKQDEVLVQLAIRIKELVDQADPIDDRRPLDEPPLPPRRPFPAWLWGVAIAIAVGAAVAYGLAVLRPHAEPPERLISITLGAPRVPADGVTTTRVSAEIASELANGKDVVVFATTAGSFVPGPTPRQEVRLSGRSVSTLIQSPAYVATGRISARVADYEAADLIFFEPALPHRILLRTSQPLMTGTAASSLNLIAQLIRNPGIASVNTDVTFAAQRPNGEPIGTFTNQTLSNERGEATAVFFVGRTNYRGDVVLTATVHGSQAIGHATVRIADPSEQ